MTNKYQTLPYLPTMFGACMVFQSLYVACLALWAFAPDFGAHEVLQYAFPGFEFLTPASFIYGVVASAIYGWFIAVVFVFSYNLWGAVARTLFAGKRAAA